MTAGPSMIDDANPASADKSIMTTEPVVPAGPVDLGVVELAVLMSASCYSRSGSWGDYDNLLGDCGRADPTLVRYLQPRPATVSQAFEVSLLVFCGDLGESTTKVAFRYTAFVRARAVEQFRKLSVLFDSRYQPVGVYQDQPLYRLACGLLTHEPFV